MPVATTERTTNPLTVPLYATKPQRRIPGTDFIAVTMHRSADGTVREYALFTSDGTVSLGTVHFHPRRTWRPACYTMQPHSSLDAESWPTLAAYADEMATRLGI